MHFHTLRHRLRAATRLLPVAALALGVSAGSGCSAGDTANMPGTALDAGVIPGALVTFHKDVEPVLQKHCQNCHSPGHIAPFGLMTYQEARGAAGLMVAQTKAHTMPPWGATSTADCAPRFGWKDDVRLSEAEIALFDKWMQDGAPEGDPKDAPPPYMPPADGLKGSQMELAPQTPFNTGGTRDQFQCFVLDPKFAQATYLNGWHFIAGNPKVVHHALMFVTNDANSAKQAKALGGATGSYTCFGGPNVNTRLVGAWAPGSVPSELPDNVATTIAPGSVFIMQIHYHPAGATNESDSTKFQMRFLPQPPTWQLITSLIGNFPNQDPKTGDGLQPDANGLVEFRIPANAAKTIDQVFTLPAQIGGQPLPELRVLTVGTHMHYVGRDMSIKVDRVTTTNGDPVNECLVRTPEWNFNWQRGYMYNTDLDSLPRLHAGDKLKMRCVYDNTMNNKFVADALQQQGLSQPRDVTLGENTLDEMCLGVFGTIFKN